MFVKRQACMWAAADFRGIPHAERAKTRTHYRDKTQEKARQD
jgi:hypothetical protein